MSALNINIDLQINKNIVNFDNKTLQIVNLKSNSATSQITILNIADLNHQLVIF